METCNEHTHSTLEKKNQQGYGNITKQLLIYAKCDSTINIEIYLREIMLPWPADVTVPCDVEPREHLLDTATWNIQLLRA